MDKYNKNITKDILQEYFEYRDGHLYWIKSSKSRSVLGDVAGTKNKENYWILYLKGESYYLHKIIFFWHNGHFPLRVDHIDRDPNNCRIENLREASDSENGSNRIAHPNKKSSKYKGVYVGPTGKWVVCLRKNYKAIWIGTFTDEIEAALAYNEAAKRIHGEFAFLNVICPQCSVKHEPEDINSAPYGY